MKIEDSKKIYDSIEIPPELDLVVKNAISKSSRKRAVYIRRKMLMRKFFRGLTVTAAGLVVCTTVALNTIPAFATEMAKLPVIGAIAKVLTVRAVHGVEENMYNVDMDVPNVVMESSSNVANTEFTEKINSEIEKTVNDYRAQAEKDFEEYKKAFFETGGTEEEWNNRKMDIIIDYDIKSQNGNILSFELVTSKGWVASNEERHYYNLNLDTDKEITLKDLLGDDYINICNESIKKQIEQRMAEDENNLYFGFGGDDTMQEAGFKTISDDTPFYINENGNPVIVFEKYEIAPGYMGYQEFEITK